MEKWADTDTGMGLTLIQLFIFIASILTLVASPSRAYETERVVIVIIDGLRYSEGLGDPNHELVPRMAELAQQGALVGNFRNDGYTYTSRAIPAIWCGTWTEVNGFSDPDCNGASNNYSELPSVFEYYRMQLQRPETDCIYVLPALCPWKASFHLYYGPDYWPLYHSVGSTDSDVLQETQEMIATHSPGLLLMYLADVDHGGHSGNWTEYVDAITVADEIVGQLWDTLQADSAYAGRTTMLVTNDHGRHDYNFQGHGDSCEGCRHIQLLAIGPDTPQGLVSEISRTIPDIAPTVGELLGFNTELATGTAMNELLTGSASTDGDSQLPQQLQLLAYPNPFNPSITINYSLSGSSDIHLTIYDLSGRLITKLLDAHHSAGDYYIKWDGTDDSGNQVGAGMYLCKVRAAGSSQTVKMVLLK